MKLRPHHICCFHFHNFSHPERGERYENALKKMEEVFKAGKDIIEVKEGPDFLCATCPYFNGERCTHPKGDEEKVRKWDRRILDELGLKHGELAEAGKLKALVKDKMPLNFCLNECSYYRQNICHPRDSTHIV